jgi:hypothetical protein
MWLDSSFNGASAIIVLVGNWNELTYDTKYGVP